MARDPWYIERIEPMRLPASHGQLREHVARYVLAGELLRGRVLDAGSGTGYGALMLAARPEIREVVAVDRDARAIRWGRRFYAAPNVRHLQGDLLAPALAHLGLFDGIACLEVLEHLPQPEILLRRLDHCLAPGGRLLVSTPLGKGRAVPSSQPFHCFQLNRAELEAMLKPRFEVTLFGQKGVTIELMRPGQRYFLMLALCRSRSEPQTSGTSPWRATSS